MRFLLQSHAFPPPPNQLLSPPSFPIPPPPLIQRPFSNNQVILYVFVIIAVLLVSLCLAVRALILRVAVRLPTGHNLSAQRMQTQNGRQILEILPLGLSTALVASFPSFVFDPKEAGKGEGEVTCIICLEDYKENDRLRRLPICGHAFHADCLDPWFKQHTTCPTCRLSFLPKSTEEEGGSPTPSIAAVESGSQGEAPIGLVVGNGERRDTVMEQFPYPQVVSRPGTLLQSEPGRH